jgi:putative integral membrane protein (TIGR02587 family)
MGRSRSQRASDRSPHAEFATGLGRAFGGSILFSLPLLMTMEMWSLGSSVAPLRLALLIVVSIPMLIALSHISGFEPTFDLKEDAVDAFVAYAVGFTSAVIVLLMFGLIRADTSADEVVGMVSLQAVAGSIGALLAQSQFGAGGRERRRGGSRHGSELFQMAIGALFLSLNVAPTEEMVLIAQKLTLGHALALTAASLAIMHGFVYRLEFHGQASVPPGTPFWSVFLRLTVTGYALALAISAYLLWTFGRFDHRAADDIIRCTVVLAFPGAIGAAAARLIL